MKCDKIKGNRGEIKNVGIHKLFICRVFDSRLCTRTDERREKHDDDDKKKKSRGFTKLELG